MTIYLQDSENIIIWLNVLSTIKILLNKGNSYHLSGVKRYLI